MHAVHCVNRVVADQPVSAVLDKPYPPINPSEQSLPRKTRCTLAQLRSGYSSFLRTYRARLDPNVSPLCPECCSLRYSLLSTQ